MPVPGNVRQFPVPGRRWRSAEPPPVAHGLSVFATLTARAVAMTLLVLVAFTFGMNAKTWMDLPQVDRIQRTVIETEQVCRDIAHGVWIERKGN